MDGGQGCRNIEESAWESGPLPIAELAPDSGIPESASRLRRSEADTMPVSDPFTAVSIGRADWCVDVGPALLSMTTFDLWSAIERSEVAPWMRVWREGMECWTPVQEVPELRWAVESALALPLPEPPAAALTTTPADHAAAELPAEATTGPIVTRAATTSAAAIEEAHATSRERSRASFEASPLESTPAPMITRPAEPLPERSWGGRWLAAGTAVAAIAILGAVMRVTGHRAPPAHAPRAGALPAGETPAVVVPASEPQPAVVQASPMPPAGMSASPVEDAPVAEAPDAPRPAGHREERGQRRLPRGGHRAGGR